VCYYISTVKKAKEIVKMANRSWKNVELEKKEWDAFRPFLKRKGIKYEASGCFNLIHIEVLVNEAETQMLNDFMDKNF
jgi:hypothetical protein